MTTFRTKGRRLFVVQRPTRVGVQEIKILALALGLCLSSMIYSAADIVTEPLRKFGLGDLQVAAISPDRKWMATCGSGGAFLWDFQTGTMLHRLEAHHAPVLSLCFSPSGVLLTGGGDAVIRAWDPQSGTELRSFVGHIGRIFNLSFAPDGKSFVSVADSTVRVWSLSTAELLHTFSFPGEGITEAKFAPDGQRLVTSHVTFPNTTNSVRVWDLATEQKIRSFGGDGMVDKFEFVAGGHLVTAKGLQDVQVWDIETGQIIRSLPGTTQAELSILGFLAATNSSTVTVGCLNGRVITWDANTGQILHDFTGEILFSLAAIPGTNQILTAHPDKFVRVKNGQVGTTLRTIAGHTAGTVSAVGFSPDDRYVVSGGNEVLTRLWNRTNAQQVATFAGDGAGTMAAQFSPDGTRVLTTFGSPNFSARLWNVQSGLLEREFFGHTSWLYAAVFSRDGRRVATSAQDGTARLWDVATGTQIRAFSIPGSLVTAVAVSSNAMMLASGYSDGMVRLWNTANGQLLRSLRLEFDAGSVTDLDFSPATGELLVAWADGVLRTFDPTTGDLKLNSLIPQGFLYAAVFSPDGRFILDGEGWPSFTARLWDARTGEELRDFAEHAGEVTSIAFNASGTSILTGADIVRLWSIADIAMRLEGERGPNGLELRWNVGTLQRSTGLSGPWFDITNAVSPWLVPTDQASQFFRVRALGGQ